MEVILNTTDSRLGGAECRLLYEDTDQSIERNTSKIRLQDVQFRARNGLIFPFGIASSLQVTVVIAGTPAVSLGFCSADMPNLTDSWSSLFRFGAAAVTEVEIPHETDGTGSFAASVSGTWAVWSSPDYSSYTVKSFGAEGTGHTAVIPRASKLSTDRCVLGSQMLLLAQRSSEAFRHTLTWRLGSLPAQTIEADSGRCAWQFTPPLRLAEQFPDSPAGEITFRLETLSGGSVIGVDEKTLPAEVPPAMAPRLVSVQITDAAGMPELCGDFIQGVSRPVIRLKAVGSFGASVRNCRVLLDGYSYEAEPDEQGEAALPCRILSGSGDLTATVRLTDSRGLTGEEWLELTVLPYHVPVAASFEAFRCTESGAEDDRGTTIRGDWTGHSAGIPGTALTASMLCRPAGSENWQEAVCPAGSGCFFYGNAAADLAYEVKLVLSDGITSAETVRRVPPAYSAVDFGARGRAIGIGCRAELSGLKVMMDTAFGHPEDPVAIYINGTELKAYIRNIIWEYLTEGA